MIYTQRIIVFFLIQMTLQKRRTVNLLKKTNVIIINIDFVLCRLVNEAKDEIVS